MTGFDLTPQALTTARADTDRAHSTLVAAIGDVAAEVTSLVGEGWRGAAATAFGDGFDEWRRGAERVLAALATTGELLGVTQQQYAASDEQACAQLDRLGARLGGAA